MRARARACTYAHARVYEDHCARGYVCARARARAQRRALARVAQGATANAGAQDGDICVYACKSVGYACVRGRRCCAR